jgi:UDP-N-acetylmuramate--alanine ligase
MPGYDIQSLPSPPAVLHFVGIGGAGMSGLARMLARRGYMVTGSDIAHSPVVAALLREGLPVVIGHAPENVGEADLLITTAAAPPDNPELIAARERGIPVVKRAAVLGMLAADRTCIVHDQRNDGLLTRRCRIGSIVRDWRGHSATRDERACG